MINKIYCTNAISSFNVTKNEMVMELSYIPYQRAYQDTWWGGSKMIIINPCWMESRSVYNNQGLNTPKKLELIKYGIKEERVVFDIEKVPNELKEVAMDRMEKYGYSFENSDFHKWFEKEFNNHYYYETVVGALGDVHTIRIFEKGHIEINVNEDYKSDLRFSKFVSDDFEVREVLKKVGRAIVEYPFFTKTKDGNLEFLKLNKISEAKVIICQ